MAQKLISSDAVMLNKGAALVIQQIKDEPSVAARDGCSFLVVKQKSLTAR